jgi:hypothetical protein
MNNYYTFRHGSFPTPLGKQEVIPVDFIPCNSSYGMRRALRMRPDHGSYAGSELNVLKTSLGDAHGLACQDPILEVTNKVTDYCALLRSALCSDRERRGASP